MIPALFDSLAWACAFALCLPGLRRRPAYGAVAVLVIAALLWLPVGGTSLLAVLRNAEANLCRGETCSWQYDYPYLVRGADGDFHLVYTWNRSFIRHLRFNRAWLEARL